MKTPPPQPELVYIDPKSGQVLLRWDEPSADQQGFFEWLASACEHGQQGQRLVSHHLGNVARIGLLRALFAKTPERFPMLLSKVVYEGTHAGDLLSQSEVEHLAREVSAIHTLHCVNNSDEAILREFETQVTELVQAAREVRKPIVF